MKKNNPQTGLEIAVIGMAGRFPGAKDIHAFWENLKNGVESVTVFSDEELIEAGIDPETIKQPNYVKAKGYVEDIRYFDSFFFNYTPNEAEIMDPQVRVFHQCAWHALENAGYDPQSYNGLIGLYAGYYPNMYWKALNLFQTRGGSEFFEIDNLNSNHFTSLICYKLNLKGPGVTINTTCSTSLVAIHMACRSLLTGEADMVLAGGISITLPSKTGYLYEEGMVMSPDGHCRAFDAKAMGTSSGNGVGIVVLKRLVKAVKDGDHIYAIIKGSAINNDGNRKPGYSAPSVEAQVEAVRATQRLADVEPESITYIETHGSGTPLGDPIEIEALKKTFKVPYKKNSCALGFVKANIGHLDAAAGAAGFIKTVLALKHRLIPPAVNFDSPNPKIDFENSPFYINKNLEEWRCDEFPLRAGVSSFGIGGTNAHVVLEEWPDGHSSNAERRAQSAEREYRLILLSAKTGTALDRMTANLADYLKENPELLADAAYTLQVGRGTFNYRRMLVCPDQNEARARSYMTDVEDRPVVFMFPGLGTQYLNMGLDLYHSEPLFRETMDRCFDILNTLAAPMPGGAIKDILYPPATRNPQPATPINRFEISQVVIFIFEYALAQLVLKWGIKPHAMIGYSFGEYVAACISGVFSLEDALTLIVGRGQLIRKIPAGAMLSVPINKKTLKPLLNDRLAIAIDNGDSCVVAGPKDAIDTFETQMQEKRYICIRLEASHGLHSMMMDPILKEFEDQVGQLTLNKPKIPYISNVTGKWITVEDAVSPRYWVTHLRETVQFSQGLKELMSTEHAVFLEVGPGVTLSTLAYQYIDKESNQSVVNLVKSPDQKISDAAYLLGKIGRLWLYGTKIDWSACYASEKRKRVPLPAYPFDKLYYPVDLPIRDLMAMVQKGEIKIEKPAPPPLPSAPTYNRPEKKTPYVPPGDRAEQILVQMWEELLGIKPIGIHDNLLDMGVTSLKGLTFVNRFKEQMGVGELIHITTVFDAPTVSELAAYFGENYPESYARLTEAQPGEEAAQSLPQNKPSRPVPENLWLLNKASAPGADENIFFVHEASGEVGVYIELCRQLGKLAPRFNCWGIKADRLKNYTPQNWRVEKLAAKYIQKIKELQPQGPYYLVSWSGGGNLVFEIALQLEQMGENLALLALIEGHGPLGAFSNAAQEFTLETEKVVVNGINEHLSDNDMDKGLEKITDIDRVWPFVVDYVKSSEVHTEELKFLGLEDELLAMLNFDGGLRVEEIVQYFNRSRTFVNAFSQYIPAAKLQTPIHYISGNHSERLPECWKNYCYTPVNYHTINGSHYSIFRHPQVMEFAHLFNELLKNINSASPLFHH